MTVDTANARRRTASSAAIGSGGARTGRFLGAALMVIFSLATVLPLLLLIISALKTNGEIIANPLSLPTHPQWHNIADAWQGGGFGAPLGRSFLNSVFVTFAGVVVVTGLAVFAGYGLGSHAIRGGRWISYLVLVLLAIPTQATLIPIFNLLDTTGTRNSFTAIILVYAAFWMPFSVMLMRAAFRSFPREIIEAARIDGAGSLATLFRIVLPVLRGPIIGVAIINAIGIWSELLFSYVLLTDPDKRTLPAALLAFKGAFVTDYRLLYAGLLISVLPILIAYAAMSNLTRKGLSAGALK